MHVLLYFKRRFRRDHLVGWFGHAAVDHEPERPMRPILREQDNAPNEVWVEHLGHRDQEHRRKRIVGHTCDLTLNGVERYALPVRTRLIRPAPRTSHTGAGATSPCQFLPRPSHMLLNDRRVCALCGPAHTAAWPVEHSDHPRIAAIAERHSQISPQPRYRRPRHRASLNEPCSC